MIKPVLLADGQSSGYGLGFEIRDVSRPAERRPRRRDLRVRVERSNVPQERRRRRLTNEDTVGAAFVTAAIFNDLFPDIAAAARAPLPGEDPAVR